MMIRIAPGVLVHQAAFGGGFVVDPASLTAVELDEHAIELLARGDRVLESGTVPSDAKEAVVAGLRDGWLVAVTDPGPSPTPEAGPT